ncbi:right-handed parallel beta-helix repeat-containing protein [Nocardioides sp. GXZ039]|uniref:right-handed parallel beta-helix repeat-containing protein n=1 Tax=Nocardioides sp. GXZ039 TaxID=3136018 RepID=UPI0030F403AF
MKRRHGIAALSATLILAFVGAAFGTALAGAPAAAEEPAAASASADLPGSRPVGTARFDAPAGSVYVSPSGSDGAPGTVEAPVRTIARAMWIAPIGGTVVLRAGEYNERVVVSKRLTLQNYPGEAAWIDGSIPVSGWRAEGGDWVRDGWTYRFDSSPTYTQGAADGTTEDWTFVDRANYPMAAHPDQVWVDGSFLREVASRDLVVPGTFFVDDAGARLVIGSDPTGRTVRATNLARALNVQAAGTVVRGIGVRRFATSVPMIGMVTVEKPDAVLEDVVIEESATTGISILATGVTVRGLTVRESGMLGIHARFADGLDLRDVLSEDNNRERFNSAPVSGGMKVTHLRGITIRDSVFRSNWGPGFWADESTYDIDLVHNEFSNNQGHGISLELSAKAIVAGNLLLGNRRFGMKINNTSDVQIWNNTISGSDRPVNLVQDTRRNTNPNASMVDKRQPWPQPEMPWEVQDITVANNVMTMPDPRGNCLLCVEDYSFKESAEQMRISAPGNVYHRNSKTAPSWEVVWSRGAGNPAVFTTLAAFTEQTGQERGGREYLGAAILDPRTGALDPAVAAQADRIGAPVPAAVAALLGVRTGARALGVLDVTATDGSGTGSGTGDGDDGTTPPGTGTGTGTTEPGTHTDALLASDDFTRAVSRGWGQAQRGGRWSSTNAKARLSVGDGRARVRLPRRATTQIRLSAVRSSRTDTGVRAATPAIGTSVGVLGRHIPGAGDYRVIATRLSGKAVRIDLVRTVGARSVRLDSAKMPVGKAKALRIRLQVSGSGTTTIRAKIWSSTRREPGAWSVTASDRTGKLQKAGAVGLLVATSGAARATSRAEFDDLRVREPAGR